MTALINQPHIHFEPPPAQGLYDPHCEHDACGVGMICHIEGQASHQIVEDGLRILQNLQHRGAYGCDAITGDGAGILLQMPHAFLDQVAGEDSIQLPQPGDYACGLVFLPKQDELRIRLMEMVATTVAGEGLTLLGWRVVPVNPEAIGGLALAAEPRIYQLFIARGSGIADADHFERKLFVLRKILERRARVIETARTPVFHVPSLSSRTIVYKGMFLADQIGSYFKDLGQGALKSALALVHQRYSTNTFPSWDLAHPFRFLCHNGEINTLRGNVNWMNAREALFNSPLFGGTMAKLRPIASPGASDSAVLDNALELLYHTGRGLAHSMMMLIPEAWQNHTLMDDARKAFYEYHSCLMEPWDGPAAIVFSDGRQVGAVLDRNGLRPSRYTVTTDGRVILASETGVIDLAPEEVHSRQRLQPGRMLLIDFEQGRLVKDDEIKDDLAGRHPYRAWIRENLVRLEDLPEADPPPAMGTERLAVLQRALGYTLEDAKYILGPMAAKAKEPIGSMGDDTSPAVLSDQPRPLFDYFRQLFAQVTNPPLDAIREALVTSLSTNLGAQDNLFDTSARHCRQLQLAQPILSDADLARVRAFDRPGFNTVTLAMGCPPQGNATDLARALDRLCADAAQAVTGGATIVVLSDRDLNHQQAPLPSLLATAAVHHHLIRTGLRTRCGLVVETGEAREVHHFCCLIGYGASAVNPYLAFALLTRMVEDGQLPGLDGATAHANYVTAAGAGILKTMSKMGISTLQSYQGAQIFEAVGLSSEVVAQYFPGTASRIGGIDLSRIVIQIEARHRRAYPPQPLSPDQNPLPVGGKYQWRRQGEKHQYTPEVIAALQQAVRSGDRSAWQRFSSAIDTHNRQGGLIRGLLRLKPAGDPLPLESVESVESIVKRFKTGAMSYGSISKEAHETLAIAMNRLGGKSNSGEGGEDADRFVPDTNGDWRNSAIKQIASGRFGVTSHYLINAAELQIKMAQGAKPGEGGQLPAEKVYPWIAKTRFSTPHVQLISPPPHHDIYSIEDLAQLIFDLKNANSRARVSVKLVSELGVGTIAAGVVKGKADVVLISGDAGGTGASPLSSIKYGGLPWELGLAETQQTLTLNGLRDKIVVECDGQLKTARDVAVACLLGAEEFGFGTIALVALGCVMMRVCHLNTCPVGIATQDPELRRRFAGRPEHVVNLMRFVAEDLRQIMADLGFHTLDEMVGRADCLDFDAAVDHWQARGIDLSAILHQPQPPLAVARYCTGPEAQTTDLEPAVALTEQVREALEKGTPVRLTVPVRNTQRTLFTYLSSQISRRHGAQGLPDDTIVLDCHGSAGQSFCAFGAPGVTVHLQGEANDYFGKGLSGARLSIRPPEGSRFAPEENIIVGNVAFYGATAGSAFICGRAGERFCVRNSGVTAVVEGVGDHGCEYMTGGCVVVLGQTGRNFAAGMSGGIAYVHDPEGTFARLRCNPEMVLIEALTATADQNRLETLVAAHRKHTGSPLAGRMMQDWAAVRRQFVKVIPVEYKRVLEQQSQQEA